MHPFAFSGEGGGGQQNVILTALLSLQGKGPSPPRPSPCPQWTDRDNTGTFCLETFKTPCLLLEA